MSLQISQRTETLTDSLPLQIAAKAKKMIAEGIDVVNLSVGEPDFHSPSSIKQAGIDAIETNFTKYTPAAGIPPLREAIAATLKEEHNLDYPMDQVVVTNGAKQAIASVLLAIVNEGDEVIYSPPCYASYRDLIALAGGTPVRVDTLPEDNYRINLANLESKITNRTRAIIVNTPNNPTGAAYTPEETRELGAFLAEKEIWVISDEIYEKLRYDGKKHLSLASVEGLNDKTALINGVSKYFAMTGWRIGFAAAPPHLAKTVAKIQSQVTGSPGSVSQKAALEAYSGNSDEPKQMVKAFHQRCDLLVSLVKEIPDIYLHEPEGAFYAFPDVSGYYGKSTGDRQINNSIDMCCYLLEEHHLSIIPGVAFGADFNVRFSFAASEDEIKKAVERFANGLNGLV